MYNCEYKIYISYKNSKLKDIAKNAPSLEDSSYKIFEFTPENACSIEDSFDCAIIMDAEIADIEHIKNLKKVLKILTVSQEEAENIQKEISDTADNIWIINGNENILLNYYRQLQDTLKCRFDKRRAEICLTTAYDSIPDLIWFKNNMGQHLMVNNGFCKATAKTKQQIYKKGHYYIWDMPEEEYKKGDYVCLESEEIVINARKTVLFDEKVKTKSGMRLFKTYKSPLIDYNGEIFGTCGIAHDVTELQNINNELNVVLESMPFAVIVEDRTSNILSTNSKFHEYFPKCGNIIGKKRIEWEQYTSLIKTLANGVKEVETHPNPNRILTLLLNEQSIMDVFNEPIGSIAVFRDVTTERKLERQALENANTDFLTGLNNRRSLFNYINTLNDAQELIITTIDLDNFKKVNDTYGHHTGDIAIKLTANKLKEYYKDDFIARLGGDEFLIITKKSLSDEQVQQLTANALKTLNKCFKEDQRFCFMSASLGVAVSLIPQGGSQDAEGLIHVSDKALYEAKNSGKSQYRIYFNNSES